MKTSTNRSIDSSIASGLCKDLRKFPEQAYRTCLGELLVLRNSAPSSPDSESYVGHEDSDDSDPGKLDREKHAIERASTLPYWYPVRRPTPEQYKGRTTWAEYPQNQLFTNATSVSSLPSTIPWALALRRHPTKVSRTPSSVLP